MVGGSTVYIPKPESLIRPVRDARIKAEFNGYNHIELAKNDTTSRSDGFGRYAGKDTRRGSSTSSVLWTDNNRKRAFFSEVLPI
ncbi:MAG: Mor transcription activator family protein [Anaerotruncus massiliensis (ex Togo et al. 2019)]